MRPAPDFSLLTPLATIPRALSTVAANDQFDLDKTPITGTRCISKARDVVEVTDLELREELRTAMIWLAAKPGPDGEYQPIPEPSISLIPLGNWRCSATAKCGDVELGPYLCLDAHVALQVLRDRAVELAEVKRD